MLTAHIQFETHEWRNVSHGERRHAIYKYLHRLKHEVSLSWWNWLSGVATGTFGLKKVDQPLSLWANDIVKTDHLGQGMSDHC